jgi:hypothetical protein
MNGLLDTEMNGGSYDNCGFDEGSIMAVDTRNAKY